jgi:hypothetical protein
LKIVVINEGVNSLVSKSLVEFAGETVSSVRTPEIEEDLIGESIGK